MAPVAGQELDLEPELRRHLLPQRREVAGLDHQHAVAGRQRVDQRRLPRAGARRGIDHDRLRVLNTRFMPGEHVLAERRRTPGRDGRSSGGRSRAARGRGRWSGPGSAGSGGRRDRCRWVIASILSRQRLDERPLDLPSAFARGATASLACRAAAQGARRRGPVRRRRAAAATRPTPRSTRSSRSASSCRAARRRRARRSRSRPRKACRSCRAAPGSSQCGQTVGAALVIDHSKYLNRMLEVDARARRAVVAAGRRARRAQRAAEAARPLVPGRRLDQRAGDARRHGRQQLLRLALDRATATWCTTCSRIDAVLASTASAGASVPMRRSRRGPTAYRELVAQAEGARTSAKRRRSKRAFRRCCATSPATTSTISARRTPTPRTCSSARKARSPTPSASTSSSRALPRHKALGVVPLPDVLHGDGADAAHRQARARRRWSSSTAR